jgi:predicted aldo/keto reductase-like oxidoreductase
MYRVLGKTGMKVKRIGFGAIPIQRLEQAESDRVVHTAVEQGINFFDTARVYSNSEERLGRVLKTCRNQVYITTKTMARSGKLTIEDLDTSLRHLQTETIDLYLCHNIGSEEQLQQVLAPGSTLEIMENARQHGKIRHIGLSGHKPWIVKKALEAYPFAVIEIPLNYIETSCLEELVPFARRQECGIIAMKPIAGGAIKGVTENLRFILTQGADVAIPGMDSPEQVKENLSVLDCLIPPTEQEIKKLENEKEELGQHFCRRCEYCMPCPQGLPISFLHVLHAYYFRYNLQDWVWERLQALPKTYRDCIDCRQCVEKCPYDLDSPGIFKNTWQAILEDRQSQNKSIAI